MIWRAPWRTRVLHTLGLDNWLREQGGNGEGVAVARPPPKDTNEEDLRTGSDSSDSHSENDENYDERALSSKLIAAVRNAERQASEVSSLNGGSAATEELGPGARATSCGNVSLSRSTTASSQGSSVSFLAKSKIVFFLPGEEDPESRPSYERPLFTKDFDGPSGHKAKRESSSKDSTLEGSEYEEESDDEWEDQCDDIAELMSQERHLMLWSKSW
jgi:hypothetical protein